MENSLKKNLSWNTIGMILYNFAIWVFSVLILRLAGARESGYYAIASSIGNTFYAISLWGMRSFIVSDQEHHYSYIDYLCSRCIAIVITIVLMLVVILVSNYSIDVVYVLVTYSLFKCAEALIELFESFAQQKLVMDINAKSMVLRGIVYILVFFVSLKLTEKSYVSFALITICSLIILFTYNFRKMKQVISFKENIDKSKVYSILKKCFPIMIFELLAAAIVAIPRLFYERIGSTEELGIYVSIYTMVVFLQLVINILIYTFAPYMAKAYAEKNVNQFKKYILIVAGSAIGLGALAEVLVYLIGHPVINLVFGSLAGEKYSYLYLGIISGVTLALTWLISQIFVIFGKNNAQVVSAIISTITCFILSKFLIDGIDCNKISIVLILSNMSFVISSYFLMKKISRSVI